MWTCHLAPSAPAPRPSSPLHFQCYRRGGAMFAPLCWSLASLVRVSGGQLAVGSGLYRLLPGLGLGHGSICVFHVGCRRPSGALAVAGPIRPHTSLATFTRSWRVWGRSEVNQEVNQVDCCHQSRLCIRSLGLKNPSGDRCFGVNKHTATHMGSEYWHIHVCVRVCMAHGSTGAGGGSARENSIAYRQDTSKSHLASHKVIQKPPIPPPTPKYGEKHM